MEFPRTVEEIFLDFKGRREGLIKALTTEVADLYQQCDDHDIREELCLYGYPDESWAVRTPIIEAPPQIPEPVLGINCKAVVTGDKRWLTMLACHCDSWLLSVAYFYGTSHITQAQRESLFDMINDLPTLVETLDRNKKRHRRESEQDCEEVEEEKEEQLCGECNLGDDKGTDKFWICCDTCDTWFHGKCVNIRPAKAKRIGKYKCQICSITK